jgi:hypothetical protein
MMKIEPRTFLFFFNTFFIRIYSLWGGSHSDNSDETYIVHCLHWPHHISPLIPFTPQLKQLQEDS